MLRCSPSEGACSSFKPDVFLVGATGGTHIGGSFLRGACENEIAATLIDTAPAFDGPRVLRSLVWRTLGRRPLHLRSFSKALLERVARKSPSTFLISTGQAPISAVTLSLLKQAGVTTANYSTDDPWNPNHSSTWHLKALREYDFVFTPRTSNLDDFKRLGVRHAAYLPFAYDPVLFGAVSKSGAFEPDVLFVGGADNDRVAFIGALINLGIAPSLVGGYWDRCAQTRKLSLGQKSPQELVELTASAKVNVCLVRRANRDGHVMRSFEIPAIGGFMIAEDTADHRDMFGEEGTCVLYFGDAAQAAVKIQWALAHPAERQLMAKRLQSHIMRGRNTYGDRLQQMLSVMGYPFA